MKSTFLIVISVFLAVVFANAQRETPYLSSQTFRVGPILGLNLSQVDGDNDAGVHKVGIHTGLGSYVSLAERLGFQLEILYTQKGSTYARSWESPAGPYQMVYKLKMNYLEIPLALQYYYKPNIHVGFGASYNRLLNTSEEWRSLFGWKAINASEYPFEKNVVEGFLSAGYRITDGLIAEVRYQRSLTPTRLREHIHQDFSTFKDQHNNYFTIRFAYYL